MKTLLFLTVVFSGVAAYAQEYNITFKGSGASSTVETVKAENLTRGLSVTLNGNDILHLSTPTGTEPVSSDSSAIRIYPNPAYGSSTLEITPPAAGDATITIFDMSGKAVALIRSALDISVNNFRISGLKPGLFIIDVRGEKYDLAGRLISNGPAGIARIEKLKSGTISLNKSPLNKSLRGLADDRYLEYSPGDLLKFTGTSGKYKTVVTDDPEDSKSITFNFVTCTDADNNNYAVVKIGDYTWMAENLKTTKYRDGTPIPYQIFDDQTPDSLMWSWAGYSLYNNDQGNKNIYGALYSMAAFKSGKLCPAGWHAPNHSEWVNLADVLGGHLVAGGKLKETGTSHWAYPNTGATNESGFTALPAGRWDHGKFLSLNNLATFWSVTKCGGSSDCGWSVSFSGKKISWSDVYEEIGYSVRCVYGEEPKIPEVRTGPHFNVTSLSDENITATRAYTECNVYNDHGLAITQSGVCWSTLPMPTINDPHTSDGSGQMTGLTPGTRYFARGYATNSAGTGYGMSISFITKMTDVEENLYRVIPIGQQYWLGENLKTTRFRDNTSIRYITDQPEWSGTTSSAYCAPPELYSTDQKYPYGLLYNWYSVNTGKLCPSGWHVPSDADWIELRDYLIANGYNYDGSTTGNKIGVSMSHDVFWETSSIPGAVGNRDYPYLSLTRSGFGGEAVGLRDNSGFAHSWKGGYWWSASQSSENGILYYLYYDKMGFYKETFDKNYGLSVRCLKDKNPAR